MDREMWELHRAVRNYVPVFDRQVSTQRQEHTCSLPQNLASDIAVLTDLQGNEIPLGERCVNAGDVVQACVSIDGQLFILPGGRPFLGISRNVRSVMVLSKADANQ